MEAFLVDFFGEAEYPGFDDVLVCGVEREVFFVIIEKFDSQFVRKYIFLNRERDTSIWWMT